MTSHPVTGTEVGTPPAHPDAPGRRARARWWAWARPLGGVAILAVLVAQLGTGPFLDAVRRIDGWALLAAVGIAVLTTVSCAWRWSLVANGLGVAVPLRTAVPAYYQSQFLNTTLPGGVLGDVDRAVQHGRDVGNVGRGLRAVVWERSAGQVVQLVLTVVVLVLLPSPVRSSMPVVVGAAVAVALAVVLLARALPRRRRSLWGRTVRTAHADLRHGLLARRAWLGVAFASTVVVAGHLATFLIAARVAGADASPLRMMPLALLVLAAMAVPMNVAGWGPREGVAAWTFGVAGLGADQGVATAVVYGVLALVATLPGVVVLVVAWLRRDSRDPAALPRPEGVARD